MLHDLDGPVDRHGEPDADDAGGVSAEGGDRSVDPDHSALEVDQRATGVASGDRGTGLIIAAAVNRHSRALTNPPM